MNKWQTMKDTKNTNDMGMWGFPDIFLFILSTSINCAFGDSGFLLLQERHIIYDFKQISTRPSFQRSLSPRKRGAGIHRWKAQIAVVVSICLSESVSGCIVRVLLCLHSKLIVWSFWPAEESYVMDGREKERSGGPGGDPSVTTSLQICQVVILRLLFSNTDFSLQLPWCLWAITQCH